MLGHQFSVITMWDRWKPLYRKVALELEMQHRLASIESIDTRPDAEELLAGKEEVVFAKLEAAARRAIDDHGADVIILGSTTMHQSAEFLSDALEVPVLNPGLIALKQCEMLVQLGLRHSKLAYQAPEARLASVPVLGQAGSDRDSRHAVISQMFTIKVRANRLYFSTAELACQLGRTGETSSRNCLIAIGCWRRTWPVSATPKSPRPLNIDLWKLGSSN